MQRLCVVCGYVIADKNIQLRPTIKVCSDECRKIHKENRKNIIKRKLKDEMRKNGLIKLCKVCNSDLNNNNKSGYCSKCYNKSEEHKAVVLAYHRTSKVKIRNKIYAKEYSKRPAVKEKAKKYYYKQYYIGTKGKISRRELYFKNKKVLMDSLGGAKCINCGCDVLEFLEFNHKNGGGNKWYKETGFSVYYGLRNGLIDKNEIEVTCRVCNHLHYLHRKNHEMAKRFKIIWC